MYRSVLSLLILLMLPLFADAQTGLFTDEELQWIEEHPIIEFGYEPNWPPYEVYSNGKYSGIVNEYLDRISEETGITFKPIANLTWDQSLKKLKAGEINFVPSCAITEKRKELLSFSTVYISDPIVVTTRKDANFISGLRFMKGKTIALPKNYYTVELIQKDYPGIRIIEKDGVIDCLDAVNNGEAYAFVGSLGVVSYYINNKGYTNLKIAAPTHFDDVRIAMACTKDWKIFTRIIDKVLTQISIREHNKIRQKWISVRYEYGITSVEVMTYVIVGIFILLLLSTIFLIWNRSLKREIGKREQAEKKLSNSLQQIHRQSEERKQLLQEIHHRVKNNLQVISSMLKLQAATSEEEGTPLDIEQTIDRINSISLIHEMIYKSDSIHIDDLEAYISSLIREIVRVHEFKKELTMEIHADPLHLGLKTIVPVAIIINELVINSIKHGFAGRNSGNISIHLTETEDGAFQLKYWDDGVWKESSGQGFGSSLIEIFTEQLDGTLELNTENGTTYTLQLKRQD